MTVSSTQDVYYVVFCTLKYGSFTEARAGAPDDLAAHIQRSNDLHAQGVLVMAGAFLDQPDAPLATMTVLTSREAAVEYINGDPFYRNGMMQSWEVREWENMFA